MLLDSNILIFFQVCFLIVFLQCLFTLDGPNSSLKSGTDGKWRAVGTKSIVARRVFPC